MTVGEIIHVVTDQSLGGEENLAKRRETKVRLLEQRFNFQFMSRLALGNEWSARTNAERTSFVNLFSDLLKNTYIRKIESYTDENAIFTKHN